MNDTFPVKVVRFIVSIMGRLLPGLTGRVLAAMFLRPRRHPRPQREIALLQTAEKIFLSDGHSAHAWGKGPLVLLVHGWDGRGAQLGAFVEPLVQAGYRVVAVDGPAHGDSPGKETHPLHFASFLCSLSQQLGAVDTVIAHSFGAASSLMAINAGWSVKRLVYLAGPSYYPYREFATFLGLPARAFARFSEHLEKRLGVPPQSITFENYPRDFPAQLLIMHDPEDAEIPFKHAENLSRWLSTARLEVMREVGHRRILWDAQVLAKVMAFLGADSQQAKQVM